MSSEPEPLEWLAEIPIPSSEWRQTIERHFLAHADRIKELEGALAASERLQAARMREVEGAARDLVAALMQHRASTAEWDVLFPFWTALSDALSSLSSPSTETCCCGHDESVHAAHDGHCTIRRPEPCHCPDYRKFFPPSPSTETGE